MIMVRVPLAALVIIGLVLLAAAVVVSALAGRARRARRAELVRLADVRELARRARGADDACAEAMRLTRSAAWAGARVVELEAQLAAEREAQRPLIDAAAMAMDERDRVVAERADLFGQLCAARAWSFPAEIRLVSEEEIRGAEREWAEQDAEWAALMTAVGPDADDHS
jgi:hypothetical protein